MRAPALFRDQVGAYRPQLRYGLRVTVAGLAAFALARSLNFPLHGLWAVLTAIVVSQVSVGGSLRATVEYNVGTLGGAIYAVAIGLLVPHSTPLTQALVLALSVGPLAFAAAVSPTFRVAPFSAVLVLLIGGELGESPIVSATARVLEVVIGGTVALVVSFLVLPARAQALGLDAAARILNEMAALIPTVLSRVSGVGDKTQLTLAQTRLGTSVAGFQALADEARRERLVSIVRDPDPAPLARALLRIRHDFVMLGRAAVEPFPEAVAPRLEAPLARLGEEAAAYLNGSAAALAARRPPPSIGATQAALTAYSAAIASLRSDNVLRALATADVERVYALSFALEQLCRDLADLAQRVADQAERRGL
ncbi:MAG TPA: FUSC family protein [Roseiarcus sp.]|nr:FUSC family protein [Roseiarcus sp.]